MRRVKEILKSFVPDYFCVRILYKKVTGSRLNLRNPKTYSEKLQWIKLYNRNREYTKMVDKYMAKEYVGERIGYEYIIPTIGVWQRASEIDFDKLPERFVLKCTHDSGSTVICKDKAIFDRESVVEELERKLNQNYYEFLYEWPYKNVKPRIIAEEFLEDFDDGELRDYKFYTFNGKAKIILLVTNRQLHDNMTFDYFDVEGNHLNLTNEWHPQAETIPHLPKELKKMAELAETLAKDIPHVRVDFYEANGKMYFGEMTFFDMGGFLKLKPESWDEEWGEYISLPKKTHRFIDY